jgi:hypothetical protein
MSDKTYLFERGPWPQPAPQAPDRAAPAVLHLPDPERREWNARVGMRYVLESFTQLPSAALWALRNPGLLPVSDQRFTEILTDGIIGKFLCPTLDHDDEETFAKYLKDPKAKSPEERWYKSDFTPMKFIKSEPDGDSATAPTVVLWRRAEGDRGRYALVAIAVRDKTFDRTSRSDSWELAKYFALQGAGVCTTLLMHPLLHFPTDAVNAITKTLLPKEHPIQQLLLPHFYLQLGVDDAVLHNGGTVLKSGPYRFYAPYPGEFSEHAKLVSSLWTGSTTLSGRPNSAFPAYRFPMDGWRYHCPYSEFLREYFDTVLAYTTRVAAHVLAGPAEDLALVRQWAMHASWWVPGFPDDRAITEGDNLARALASMIHDVAVGHSADHYLYSQVKEREVPFILHTREPNDVDDTLDRRSLVTWKDSMHYRMCMRLFFNPSVVTHLADVEYPFSDPALQQMARDFRADLAQTPGRIEKKQLIEYIPLRAMAAGVQF